MKPVVYHRLAASELIKSAEFYERRVPNLGEAFLFTMERMVTEARRHPEFGKPGYSGLEAGKQNVFHFESFTWNNQTDFGLWQLHI